MTVPSEVPQEVESIYSSILPLVKSCHITTHEYVMGMRDDIRTLYQALGTAVGQCRCGEMYALTACGMPICTSRCASCGALIGGHRHTYLEGNHKVTDAPPDLRGWQGRDGESMDCGIVRDMGVLCSGIARISATVAFMAKGNPDPEGVENSGINVSKEAVTEGMWWDRLTSEVTELAKWLGVEVQDVEPIVMAVLDRVPLGPLSFRTREQRNRTERAMELEVTAAHVQPVSAAIEGE
ncbi:hypothetical protein KIPB_008245 [Kipferlia bialata]|uniref:RZ-type domain-containing protein n=1 Tax=Kipferlia bialata TaxID=797122 RepID=A0A9K3GL63_9EUKA|nr:hypothetical protein KIPB_008245 [Kipferlia bialata]|eukprot:g8245.t1